MKTTVLELGLQLSDCIAFSFDWASSNAGVHDSVWSHLDAVSPNCILLKCTCHHLALCLSRTTYPFQQEFYSGKDIRFKEKALSK